MAGHRCPYRGGPRAGTHGHRLDGADGTGTGHPAGPLSSLADLAPRPNGVLILRMKMLLRRWFVLPALLIAGFVSSLSAQGAAPLTVPPPRLADIADIDGALLDTAWTHAAM